MSEKEMCEMTEVIVAFNKQAETIARLRADAERLANLLDGARLPYLYLKRMDAVDSIDTVIAKHTALIKQLDKEERK